VLIARSKHRLRGERFGFQWGVGRDGPVTCIGGRRAAYSHDEEDIRH
jgi:hypothetical protein